MDDTLSGAYPALFQTQNLIALGQFLVAAIVSVATFLIYSHGRRRDKLDFFRSNWDKQQDLNVFCIGNEEAAHTVERTVYGSDYEFDKSLAQDFNFAFIQLNKVQNNYQAYAFGVITWREFNEMSIPSLQLFARRKGLVKYVVMK